MTGLLETRDLTVTFGGLVAVDHLSISVQSGQLTGLIGPNGAGKTTMVDAVTGFVEATGDVLFDGESIRHLAPHRRAQLGLGRTWQSVELFDDLTVGENIQIAASSAPDPDTSRGAVRTILRRFDLECSIDYLSTDLSQGERKLVGVARALAARPRLVCMDEPAAGLDSSESRELGRRLRSLVDEGIAVFMIDHDMGLVLNTCDHIYVLNFGVLIADGTPASITKDDSVVEAYLGGEAGRLEQADRVQARLP